MQKPSSETSVRASSAQFVELPYTPALLSESGFPVSLTDDPEFQRACETGFDGYFENMFEWNEEKTDLVFVEQFYTLSEIKTILQQGIQDFIASRPHITMSLAWHAGFWLGWLSAVALVHSAHAQVGLDRHRAFVLLQYEKQEHAQAVLHRAMGEVLKALALDGRVRLRLNLKQVADGMSELSVQRG